jgi:hypothetical protein
MDATGKEGRKMAGHITQSVAGWRMGQGKPFERHN